MSSTPLSIEGSRSCAEVRAMLGIGQTQLCALIWLGRKFRGLHPLKGGLWPTFKLSHKNRRIPREAIDRHLKHMFELENNPKFAAEMRARARAVDNTPYRKVKAPKAA